MRSTACFLVTLSTDLPQLLDSLSQWQVDLVISGMTMTPKRNATYMLVGPYIISGQAILARGETA